MSKGLGQKIAIKFTEELIGDVSSNVVAFSITGQQRKHVGGVLVSGDYQIESVINYPLPKLWIGNFNEGIATQVQKTSNGLTLGVE